MVRKEDCIRALERRLGVFKEIEDRGDEIHHYTRCCGIVWFLEEIGVLTSDEALDWIDKIADASATAWSRITARRENNVTLGLE